MHTSDSKSRSMAKAISYRIMGASVTATIALVLTGRPGFAATFGLLDAVVKFGGYYFHERLWDRINFGRAKTGIDYEI